MLFGEPFSIYN